MTSTCVLTVCGMASALGNLVHGCAAIRAGIVRPRPILGIEAVDSHDQLPMTIVGHPVQTVTDGFPIASRWVRLAAAAFADFAAQPSAPVRSNQAFWHRCGVVLVLPPARHERFQTEGDDCAEAIRHGVVEPLVRLLGLPINPEQVRVIDVGHAGTALALADAKVDIETGKQDACLLIATDSLLDSLTLEWLADRGRLKCDGQPCGLAPGEAGVCLLVEQASSAAARSAAVVATLVGAAFQAFAEGARSAEADGKGLADTFAIALTQGPPGTPLPGQVIADLNGEVGRSEAFAIALQALSHRQHMITGDVLLPAGSLGDTGAASGAIGVCVAARTFCRQPQAFETSAIVSLSERGDRGVIITTRPR